MKSFSGYIQDDLELEAKLDIFAPNVSSLFNTLRKTSELAVLQPNLKGTSPMLPETMDIDFTTAKPNYIKTLLNFKKVVLVGDLEKCRTTIKTIKEIANTQRFYMITEALCLKFLEEFPIFEAERWERSKIEGKDIPILVVDTRDFVDCSSRVKVYIHTTNKADMKKYSLLGLAE